MSQTTHKEAFLKFAEELHKMGISVQVLDADTGKVFDVGTILNTDSLQVQKTKTTPEEREVLTYYDNETGPLTDFARFFPGLTSDPAWLGLNKGWFAAHANESLKRPSAPRVPKKTAEEKFDDETRRQIAVGWSSHYGSSEEKGLIFLHKRLTIAFRRNQEFYEVALAHRHEDDDFDAFIGGTVARKRLAAGQFIRVPVQQSSFYDEPNANSHLTSLFAKPEFAFNVPGVDEEVHNVKNELSKRFPFIKH